MMMRIGVVDHAIKGVPSQKTAHGAARADVLLIDDDPRTYVVLSPVFERAGLSLRSARSGDEALRLSLAVAPDLILLDIVMPPGVDGYETLRQLRCIPSTRSTPVVILSSIRHSEERVRGLELGAVDFVSKPVKSEEVLARARTHLTISRLQSDLADRNAELRGVNERMSRDLEAAARIQRALLPAELPHEAGYEFGWAYRPCTELGGDGLGVFRLDRESIGFYLLDVSGHGVAASLLAVSAARVLDPRLERSALVVKGSADDGTRRPVRPGEVLKRMNLMFPLELERNPHFMTMLYGVLHAPSGVVRYAAGGHPDPILASHRGITPCSGSVGVPIGVRAESEFTEAEIRLRPGERLFIHSDGLNEQVGGDAEQYGLDRLRHAVAVRGSSIQETVEAAMNDVIRWALPSQVRDDLSLLAIGRLE